MEGTIDKRKISATRLRRKLLEWGTKHRRSYPWRNTTSPWHALIAEVLLQRTNVAHVSRYYEELIRRYPTPESVIECPDTSLAEVADRVGLKRRIRTLRELAEYVDSLDFYPADFDDLVNIYGIGHYTASAYLSLHRNVRAVLVDANVARWLARLTGEEQPKDVRRCAWLWELAEKLTPKRGFREYNYAVLDFTMVICSRRPKCEQCPMSGHCAFFRQTRSKATRMEKR